MSVAGALRFGRYAFPPNRLGYCGPEDHQALFDYVSEKTYDKGLLELAQRFEGAYPYLVLIAQANRIADPFDDRVVDAYWIGNELLEKVPEAELHNSLQERFRKRMTGSDWKWLAGKLEHAAKPHHNFHVFDIYCRAGLMKDDKAEIVIETMDSCRVSWGIVHNVRPGALLVERQPLVIEAGRLALGESQCLELEHDLGGLGFAGEAKVGDTVSIHWNWACAVLNRGEQARLKGATGRCLALANETI